MSWLQVTLLSLALGAPQADSVVSESLVKTYEESGDIYCDVQARGAQIHHVMAKLARSLEVDLRGFEDVEESRHVNAFLQHRPVDQAIQFLLGSVGMTATVTASYIEVRGELPPFPDTASTLQAAEIAYLKALQRYPHSEEAPKARMSLAEISLDQGFPARAVRHYEALIDDYPSCEFVHEAHMRAGRLLVGLEQWPEAQAHFEAMANIKIDEATPREWIPMIAEARRELARCVLWRGEPRRAQYMLQGLEHSIPPTDDADLAQRLLLMARALLDLGRGEEGILFLDRAMQLGTGVVGEFESMDLRARGMELADKPIEAAVAWLHWSRSQDEDNKRKALARAAHLALSVEGEELAVLFLHKQAQADGLGDELLPFVNEARSRLGLAAESYTNSTPSIRLERGEQLLASGSTDQAADVFASIEDDFWGLTAANRLRYALAYAPLLETESSVDAAIELLRQVARSLESRDNRAQLYVLAAEIYERHGRFDEAAEAYGGKL